MKRIKLFLFAPAIAAAIFASKVFADEKLPYQQDFEKAEVGKVPEDFMVLDGGFAVKEENGSKFLELPGAPLDSFAVQFGPAETDNLSVTACITGSAKGRRFPVFGVGLNGVAGYKLQVSSAKNAIELFKDQDLKASAAYDWKSGVSINLRLQLRNTGQGAWKIEGKVWPKAGAEPEKWMIAADEKEQPQPGRPSVFGSPFAGTPIRFDDLKVERGKPER